MWEVNDASVRGSGQYLRWKIVLVWVQLPRNGGHPWPPYHPASGRVFRL
jgi:hypothetical protein